MLLIHDEAGFLFSWSHCRLVFAADQLHAPGIFARTDSVKFELFSATATTDHSIHTLVRLQLFHPHVTIGNFRPTSRYI